MHLFMLGILGKGVEGRRGGCFYSCAMIGIAKWGNAICMHACIHACPVLVLLACNREASSNECCHCFAHIQPSPSTHESLPPLTHTHIHTHTRVSPSPQSLRLDAILTVVDSKHCLIHLDEIKPDGIVNEAIQQVAFADKILLNKVDLVNEREKGEVVRRIKVGGVCVCSGVWACISLSECCCVFSCMCVHVYRTCASNRVHIYMYKYSKESLF
jgi:hypothetical protein